METCPLQKNKASFRLEKTKGWLSNCFQVSPKLLSRGSALPQCSTATTNRGNCRKTWLAVNTRLINPGYQRLSERAALRSFKAQRKRGPFWIGQSSGVSLDLGAGQCGLGAPF